jgi:hypothetical protein
MLRESILKLMCSPLAKYDERATGRGSLTNNEKEKKSPSMPFREKRYMNLGSQAKWLCNVGVVITGQQCTTEQRSEVHIATEMPVL